MSSESKTSMSAEFQQIEQGFMVHPTRDRWRKAFFKLPLYAWRSGLGFLLHHRFLVLTTTGRKSGLARHTVVEYALIDGQIVVVSGWGRKSAWVKNIEADNRVTIQSAQGTGGYEAQRLVADAEIRQMWQTMKFSPAWDSTLASFGIDPDDVEDLLAKKDRILAFRMLPTAAQTPPPLKKDLAWVWGVVGLLFLVLALTQRN